MAARLAGRGARSAQIAIDGWGRSPSALGVLCAAACLMASVGLVSARAAGAATTHPRSERTATGASYGVGPKFCTPWKGLSHDMLTVGGVYPCANPAIHDTWGASGAADLVNRYEWADHGLVADVAAGDVVRTLNTVDKVPIGSMGQKQLPGCGDVISMFGGTGTNASGFAGVVVAVNVSNLGSGTITYLDEDGTLYHGLSSGEDQLHVAAWVISTGWTGSAAYTQFDWTLQTGGWQCASEVPGTAKLNAGGNAVINSVSCASTGNCVAGGYFKEESGSIQALVDDEVAGTWKPAIEVPGTAKLNAIGIGSAGVSSVSCASPGNCAAGGYYLDATGSTQAFVADEVAGTWKPAIGLPGTSTLNLGGDAQVSSVSCGSPRNCAVGGWYQGRFGDTEAFVADEVAGTWKPAIEVPGTAALNAGGYAQLSSVSCGSAGNCAAGGYFSDSSGSLQAFVVDEVAGTWKPAIEVPGTATLNAVGGYAAVQSVSCASAGNCAAGGWYAGASGLGAFVANEVAGTWKPAIEVPGTAKLDFGGDAAVLSVSCPSPGNCAAGGWYADASGKTQAFVADEVAGTWKPAIEVPGTANLNAGGNEYSSGPTTAITSVSCASPSNCVAGGTEAYAAGSEAIVADEVGGVWKRAAELPGTSILNAGGTAGVSSVSCASAGNCVAGGYYEDGSGNTEAFVADDVDS